MSDFIDYARSLLAAGKGLIHDYRGGDFTDYSGNGAAVTIPSSTDPFEHGTKGFKLPCRSGGIVVPDQASLQVSAAGLSVVCFIDWAKFPTGSFPRLLAKASAAEVDYEFAVDDSSDRVLISTSGGSSRFDPFTDFKCQCLGFSLTNGAVPAFYSGGLFLGNGNNARTASDSEKDLYLGSNYTGDPLTQALQSVLIYPNVVLTDEQHATLYELWLRSGRARRSSPRIVVPVLEAPADISTGTVVTIPGNVDSSDELVSTDGSQTFTRSGSVQRGPSPIGAVVEAAYNAVSSYSRSDLTPWTVDEGSLESWVVPRQGGISGRYFAYSPLSSATRIGISSTGFIARKGATDLTTPSNTAHVDCPAHLILTWWLDGGTRRFELFLDGVSQGAGTFTSSTSHATFVLLSSSTASAVSCPVRLWLARKHSGRVSAIDAQKLYQQYAEKHVVGVLDRNAHPVSVANMSAGRVGPYDVVSGTFRWEDDGTRRKATCVSAGVLVEPSSQAFGAWYFRANKVGDLNTLGVLPIASQRAGFGGSSQNGYRLAIGSAEGVSLERMTNGVEAATIIDSGSGYVTIDTEYEFFLSRRYDGLFTLWIRGGAFSTWTVVGSGTDTAYTDSNFVVADIDANDEVSAITAWPAGGALRPFDILALADSVGHPTIQNDQSTLNATEIRLSAPSGSNVTVFWGDGTSDPLVADGSVKMLTHNYTVTGQYQVEVVGDVGQLTSFYAYNQAWLSGDLADVVAGLSTSVTFLRVDRTSVSGDVSAVSGLTSLVYLRLFSTSVSGDVSAVSGLTSLITLYLHDTSISGDVSAVSGLTSLMYLRLYDTSISGDVSAVSGLTSLVNLYIFNTPISSYTSGALPAWAGTAILVYNLGLSTVEVDNFLIDLADGVGAGGLLNYSGGNDARSSASDAAVTALTTAGWTLT